jgi:hypothetical protein
MTRLRWLSALLLTAIGLYFSRALLDIVAGSTGVVRVAMLPPWWELAAFAIVLGGIAVAVARGDRDPDVVLPLCALGLLAVPYVPWLPDRVPLLRALAGPARDVLWIVVFWLVGGRALVGLRWPGLAARAPLAVFVASGVIIGAVAWRLTSSSLYPSGDEPHYLVITQSLLNDGDLKIENNHQRGDYRAYYGGLLRPDYLTRGKDRQIYSIHPVGLAVLAMPAFALAGYGGVVAMLVVMAALAATLLWLWARETSGSTGAATFAWAAAALTAPFLFNSFTVYPEIPGALALLIALAWRPNSAATAAQVARGVALGTLPWFSTKYAAMAAAATLVLMVRAGWNLRALTALLAPVLVLLIGWFGFFYWIWGTISPSAPYGASEPMTLGYLAHGGPGLFFDQEYGIVAYAPVLALAFIGLIHMLRAGGDQARRALEVTMVLAALVATVGAFHIWWGGSAAPGRPVASAVLLLGVPIASFFAAARERPAARAACQALLATSVAVALALATKQDGSLLHNDRDGTATLLEWMSPTWPLTSVFPSFIRQTLGGAAARTLGWLTVGGLVASGARLLSPRRIGAASLAFVALGVTGGVVYASATRPATAPAAIDPTARARVPLLDDFDAHRRPIVVVYDPWTRTSAADVLARAVLIARPGERTSRQPVELLWNARFALPAGEYRVDLARPVELSQVPGAVGLQIGRVGPPLDQWRVESPAWSRAIMVPIDATLIGLRPLAKGGLDEGELRITPIRVVDESRRSARPPVFSATRYGVLTAYFHDDTTTGEAAGFWTHGRGVTRVTVATSSADPASFDVDVNCGPIANRATLQIPGWTEQIVVEPGGAHHVTVQTISQPDLGIRLAPLDITVRDGFVPAEVDPASSDRRVLGCWIEMGSSALR